MLGQYQAETKKEYLPGFVNDGSQRIGQDALECDSAFPNRRDYPGEPGFGQNDARGRFGDVGGGRHRDADLCLAQRRRVIGAVSAHADRMAGVLKRLDQPKLVFGEHASEDGKIVRSNLIGNLAWQTNGTGEPDRIGDEGGRRGRISRHHDGVDPERAQLIDHGL